MQNFGINGLNSNEWRSKKGSEKSPDEIFDLVTYDIWEIISSIDVEIIDEIGGTQKLNYIQNDVNSNGPIVSRVHPKFGKCVVYSPMRDRVTKGVNTLKISQNNGLILPLRIFIHADDQFWDATNRNMGYKLETSDIATAQVFLINSSLTLH